MSIDVVEIMKTGLFELHYARKGDSEEWSIVPTDSNTVNNQDFTLEWSGPFYPEDDLQEDRVSPQFTDIDSMSKSPNGTRVDDIPWGKISHGFDWVAMDDDGDWYAYKKEPEVLEDLGQWDIPKGGLHEISTLEDIDMPTPPHWTESLVRRPE